MSEIRVLRTPEAAARLGLSISTLEKMRCVGGGPKFVRLGGRAVGYPVEALDEWIAGLRQVSSTSEAGNAIAR